MIVSESKSKLVKGSDVKSGSLFSFFRSLDLPVTDIMPYKRCTDNGILVDAQDEYQAILRVKTTDLVSLNETDLKVYITQFTNLCRLYTDSLKLLALTYNTETTEQQVYWRSRMLLYRRILTSNLTSSETQRYTTMLKLASDNHRRSIWVEENLTELTFFFIVYGKTEKQITERLKDIQRYGGKVFALKQLDQRNVEDLIFRLTNMNTDL